MSLGAQAAQGPRRAAFASFESHPANQVSDAPPPNQEGQQAHQGQVRRLGTQTEDTCLQSRYSSSLSLHLGALSLSLPLSPLSLIISRSLSHTISLSRSISVFVSVSLCLSLSLSLCFICFSLSPSLSLSLSSLKHFLSLPLLLPRADFLSRALFHPVHPRMPSSWRNASTKPSSRFPRFMISSAAWRTLWTRSETTAEPRSHLFRIIVGE